MQTLGQSKAMYFSLMVTHNIIFHPQITFKVNFGQFNIPYEGFLLYTLTWLLYQTVASNWRSSSGKKAPTVCLSVEHATGSSTESDVLPHTQSFSDCGKNRRDNY